MAKTISQHLELFPSAHKIENNNRFYLNTLETNILPIELY